MKSLALVLSLSCLTSLALAETTTPYSADAIELVGIVRNCTAELAKFGDARMVSATHLMENDYDEYTLNFESGGWAPSFRTYSVGSLVISRSWEPSFINAPDAPGGAFHYGCKIVKPQPQQ